ncbi:Pheromone shutdown TraB [Trinorchestia longiramus]|nr:Pheromone shutdown TraB [Trinorchestia longiramus]
MPGESEQNSPEANNRADDKGGSGSETEMVVAGSMQFALTPSAAAVLHTPETTLPDCGKNEIIDFNDSNQDVQVNVVTDENKSENGVQASTEGENPISEKVAAAVESSNICEGKQEVIEADNTTGGSSFVHADNTSSAGSDTSDKSDLAESDGVRLLPVVRSLKSKKKKLKKRKFFKLQRQPVVGELPSTVVHLMGPNNCEVFVVGTAHFSEESQRDVVVTIEKVRPDVVVLELCRARTAILSLDEETILMESTNLDFAKMRAVIAQHGRVQGLLYLLLLSVSAHITKQLGMAPGGELRVAVATAKRLLPRTSIQLGDRPINITLGRALAALSPWSKLKLAFHIITTAEPISKEDVEKCKNKDMIEELLAEMTGQFPAISEVFVTERDMYLSHSLHLACCPSPLTGNQPPRRVVGVVGIGHQKGIEEYWGKVTHEQLSQIVSIPPASYANKLVSVSWRLSLYCLAGYCCYRLANTSLGSRVTGSVIAVTSSVAGASVALFEKGATKAGLGGRLLNVFTLLSPSLSTSADVGVASNVSAWKPPPSSAPPTVCCSAGCGDDGKSSDNGKRCRRDDSNRCRECSNSNASCSSCSDGNDGKCSSMSNFDGTNSCNKSYHDNINKDSTINGASLHEGDSEATPVNTSGEDNLMNCFLGHRTGAPRNNSESPSRTKADLAWAASYGPDEYDHPEGGVVYITSSVPGLGVDVELFEQMPMGCRCQRDCSGLRKVEVPEKYLYKRNSKNCNSDCSDTNSITSFEFASPDEVGYFTTTSHSCSQALFNNSKTPSCAEKDMNCEQIDASTEKAKSGGCDFESCSVTKIGLQKLLYNEEPRSSQHNICLLPSDNKRVNSSLSKVVSPSRKSSATCSLKQSVSLKDASSVSSAPNGKLFSDILKFSVPSSNASSLPSLSKTTPITCSSENLVTDLKSGLVFCSCMNRVPQTYSEMGLLLHSNFPWPVYECNDDCDCPGVDNTAVCGNRVVQRGPRKNLKIVKSEQGNANGLSSMIYSNLSNFRTCVSRSSSSDVLNDSPKSMLFEKISGEMPKFFVQSLPGTSREECSSSKLSLQAEVKETDGPPTDLHPSKGYCVVTKNFIPLGAFICEYAGEIIGVEEAKRRFAAQDATGKSNYILVLREYCSLNMSLQDCDECESGQVEATSSSHEDGCGANLTESHSNYVMNTSLETRLLGSEGLSNLNSFTIGSNDCKNSATSGEGIPPFGHAFVNDKLKNCPQDSIIRITQKNIDDSGVACSSGVVGAPTVPEKTLQSISSREKKPLLTIIDPTYLGNIGRYMNHSCEPNVHVVPVRVNSMVPLAAMFALRHIQAGEELVYDYSSPCITAQSNSGDTRVGDELHPRLACATSEQLQRSTLVDVESHDNPICSNVVPDQDSHDLATKLHHRFTFASGTSVLEESSSHQNDRRGCDTINNSSSPPRNRCFKRQKIQEDENFPHVHRVLTDEDQAPRSGRLKAPQRGALRTPCLCRSPKCRGFLPLQTDLF